jgi:hypothetical protein
MNRMSMAAVAALLLTALGLGGLYWWQRGRTPQLVVQAPAEAASAAAEPASAPSAPAIRYPVDTTLAASAPAPQGGDAHNPWRQALTEAFGQAAVLRFVQTDAFAQRFVATVDNLARPHAAPRMWPVNQTPGRFSVSGQGELRSIGPDNAARYAPLVVWISSLDARRAAGLYARMYPQLQQAYEELGFPGRYFNDRVVEVIDHLLETPEPAPGAPLLQLTEVKGSVPSTQPWLRYEFADPSLQSLSSGQRILLRVGPAHRQALKAKLREMRVLLTRAPTSR